jgi:hypothetical protein
MSQIFVSGTGGGGSGIQSINGDTGTATGITITFNANSNAGASVIFSATGSTVSLIVTDANVNTFIGEDAGVVGTDALSCVGIGSEVLSVLDDASPGYTTAVGNRAGVAQTTGGYSSFFGYTAGSGYTSGSSNISIGYASGGLTTESHTLRIGNATGSGTGNLSAAYICGIEGVDVGSVAAVVTVNANKLGSATITAGTGIVVTPTANTITIASTGTTTYAYTSVNHAASPYTVLDTDEFLSCDVTAGVITVRLPNAPATGRSFVIKDKVGLAATSNITVTTVGGAINIDGATTFVMNTAYEAIQVIFNGTSYEVF